MPAPCRPSRPAPACLTCSPTPAPGTLQPAAAAPRAAGLTYRRDKVLETLNAWLKEQGDEYLKDIVLSFTPEPHRPHVHVIGQHLTGAMGCDAV